MGGEYLRLRGGGFMDFFKKSARAASASLLVCYLIVLPRIGLAQESVTDTLRKQIGDMQEQLKKALDRIDQLEREKSASSTRIGEVEKSVQAVQSAPTALNPSIGLVLDANVQKLGTAGGLFDFRSAELGIAATVDPFARMYSFINGTKDGVEVDEAAAITTSLPWNLT